MRNPSCLIIAGSDSSSGAGLQADLKTCSAHNVYAATVITALTAQNTIGVNEVMNVTSSMIESQLKTISEDLKISIIKIGMLSNSQIIETISFCLKKYFLDIPVILDPVMVAKGGSRLIDTNAINVLKKNFLNHVSLITPNIPEAEVLTGVKIENKKDMIIAGKRIIKLGAKNVLIKGGHLKTREVIDIYLNNTDLKVFTSPRYKTINTHGTGCTLSSAITTFFSCGKSIKKACELGIKYVNSAILTNPKYGKGHGPINHLNSIKINKKFK